MRRILAFTAALGLGLIPISSLALGLGDIKLNSALNQRFDADIPVVAAASEDVSSLSVELASQDAFDRAGVQRVSTLLKLHFDVVTKNGKSYIHVTTEKPVKDPFLTFLVQADWSSGKLVREYTVLLDPPVFAPSKPSATQTPVAAGSGASTTSESSAPASTSSEPMPAAASSGSQAPSMQSGATNGSTYGPIRRGQTLWGIANRVRPDDVSVNQMMVALYRSNPDAFMGNINRMKAGYILRVPSASDVRNISRAEANAAVRRANNEWRGGTGQRVAGSGGAGEGGHLQLVAPSGGSESTAAVPGAGNGSSAQLAQVQKQLSDTQQKLSKAQDENSQLNSQVQDLQGKLDESKRLVSVKDSQLQALQQKVQSGATQPPTAQKPQPKTTPPKPEVQTSPASKPKPVKPKPIESPPPRKVSLLDKLKNPVMLGAASLLLILLVVVILVFLRKRRAAKATLPEVPAFGDDETVIAADQPSDDDWLAGEQSAGIAEETTAAEPEAGGEEEEEFTPGETATFAGAVADQDEEAADSDKTVMMEAGEAESLADTVVGGKPVTLDESDPLAEADFHMAYGLYDQAGDLIRRALDKEPDRRDLMVKLLEIYFASGQMEPFVETAKKLRAAMGDTPDSDWDNVAIMGRQIAPDESLFAESGAGGGGSVDLDFAAEEGGDSETTDFDVFSEEDTGAGLDFDLDETGTGMEAAAGSEAEGGEAESIDFELPETGLETGETAEAETPAAAGEETTAAADEGMDFDLGDFDFETTTSTGTESPAAEVPEPQVEPEEALAADTETAGTAVGEESLDGLELDVDISTDESAGEAETETTFTGLETGAGEGEPEATTFSGLETEVMLDETAGAEAESLEEDGGEGKLTDTQSDFDQALSELSQYVDTNFPSEGGPAEAEVDSSDEELEAALAGEESAVGEAGAEEDSFAASPEDEVSTKLDLASAYIEMGDPDGARSILEEVLEEGNDAQKQEAQKLLDQVS